MRERRSCMLKRKIFLNRSEQKHRWLLPNSVETTNTVLLNIVVIFLPRLNEERANGHRTNWLGERHRVKKKTSRLLVTPILISERNDDRTSELPIVTASSSSSLYISKDGAVPRKRKRFSNFFRFLPFFTWSSDVSSVNDAIRRENVLRFHLCPDTHTESKESEKNFYQRISETENNHPPPPTDLHKIQRSDFVFKEKIFSKFHNP